MTANGQLRIFHISPDWCGQERLAQVFRMNGLSVACHENGRLAEDLFFAKARGTAPLTAWQDANLITGLYRNAPHWRPPLEAWREFAFLQRHFPDAHFILTLREPEDWLADRLARSGGMIARTYAHHLGVDEAALPDIWLADWHAHLDAVAAHFGEDPRLVRIDLDRETLSESCARLSDLVKLPNRPRENVWLPPPNLGQVERMLATLDRPAPGPVRHPEDWIESVAGFCLGQPAQDQTGRAGVSQFYCEWDGDRGFHGRNGHDAPMVLAGQVALARPDAHHKLVRAEGVVNDALRLGRRQPLRIDMEDSRWMGSPLGDPLGVAVICHNRRLDARNVVLWPLPGQHDIGMPGFVREAAPDEIPFEDKIDRLVWRGMISGSRMREGVKPGPASHTYLTALAAAGEDQDARQAVWADLSQTSRLAFVRRFFDHPDFDLGVVMAWGYREFARDPLLAPYCKPREAPDFFRRYRYQLCLGGYDHGSNFITAINSRSVLLAEDDGWQVFYSGRFQPWKHFIPVARYAADIEEKLAWARENPAKCKAMSEAARAEVACLADPKLRRGLIGAILDGLAFAR